MARIKKEKFPDEFLTFYEKSGYKNSPRHEETIKYFQLFVKKTHSVKETIIGYTSKGIPIYCYIVANGSSFTPKKARRQGKGIVLIQNGIHPGEIEGKDACMLLLRDILITKKKKELLDNLVLLVIPVLNVDGHERLSPFNRPNQNGPEEMGWRTTALNLNLNRDYLKADTSEMRSLLRLFSTWLPDFFIDNHTTNGADYQYHVTYGIEKHRNIHPSLARFVKDSFLPFLLPNIEKAGFLIGPYVETKEGTIESGIIDPPSLPRLSTGYAAVQNRIALLVETHSLKPFKNRVESTYAMNYLTLKFLNENISQLKKLNKKADEHSIKRYVYEKRKLPINFNLKDSFDVLNFKGYKAEYFESEITGSLVPRYTKKKIEFEVPFYNKVETTFSVQLPSAYLIPKEFIHIVRILKLHGIKVEQIEKEEKKIVERYKFVEPKFAPRPYEGRTRVEFKYFPFTQECLIEKGTYIVSCRQRGLRVIANLLEPEAEDSFVKWGFFNAFFERKEYAEDYIFEPIAKKMLSENKMLQEEFFSMLEDEEFRNDPSARLDFFYTRSKYFDKNELVYPIMRLI